MERAVVEANRLNEMVWAMDVQIAKLNEGSKQVARAEDTVTRMEKLAEETHAELSAAAAAREEFSREFARLDKESRTLSDYLKTTVERLSVDKKEFDAFDHRLRGLSTAVTESETRMDGVLASSHGRILKRFARKSPSSTNRTPKPRSCATSCRPIAHLSTPLANGRRRCSA